MLSYALDKDSSSLIILKLNDMEKLKEIIKWIAVDGLLHFLARYAIMLTCEPVVGIWWAKAITATFAIGKEVYDALRGTNNAKQMVHDFICDGAGILMADVAIFGWWLCGM